MSDTPPENPPPTRRHRGPHPADAELFAPPCLGGLRQAVADLSWLLSRGYSAKASLKLTGDRYLLRERQRMAAGRAACADGDKDRRLTHQAAAQAMKNRTVMVDAFNLLITIETALSGGVIIRGRDGCRRDLSGVHGSYHAVLETDRALQLAGECFAAFSPAHVCWLLDQPVSNSGRLAARIREIATTMHWPWEARLVMNPDAELKVTANPVITTDSIILDHAVEWINFNEVWLPLVPDAWVIDLSGLPE